MLDPDIEARVRELEAQGVRSGDAIGQAAYERDHADEQPVWLEEFDDEDRR